MTINYLLRKAEEYIQTHKHIGIAEALGIWTFIAWITKESLAERKPTL